MRSQPYGRSEGVNTETSKGGSGGGGVMAMVLPLYAGGIFIYLIYTGTKVGHENDYLELNEKLSNFGKYFFLKVNCFVLQYVKHMKNTTALLLAYMEFQNQMLRSFQPNIIITRTL